MVAITLITTACSSAETSANYKAYGVPDWTTELPLEDSPAPNTYTAGDYRIEGIAVRFLPDSATDANASWARIITEARMLFGESAYQRVLNNTTFSLTIGYEPNLCVEWAIGCAGDRGIFIQEGQNVELAMRIVSEPIGKDGVTETERLVIFIHEFAHLLARPYYIYTRMLDPLELSPTTYGQRNMAEDFAESVTFFLLWPRHLEAFHPSRYETLKYALRGVEQAQTDYGMPPFQMSRLTFGTDGTFSPAGYLPQTYWIASQKVTFDEGSGAHENAQYILEFIAEIREGRSTSVRPIRQNPTPSAN